MKNFYIVFLIVCSSMTVNSQTISTTMTVSAGTGVYVSSGTPISASELTLKSSSDQFSALFLNEPLNDAIIVNYDRHVNLVGKSGDNGGNDLISMPVKNVGETYANFLNYSADGLLTNADVLPQHPSEKTIYAFGPYDNVSRKYLNYDMATNGGVLLQRGIGYRAAARKVGQTLRFSGKVSTETETVEITTSRKNRWNSVGNPFPTYLDPQKFLDENSSKLDSNAEAIYGYNSGTRSGSGTIGNFIIINRLTFANEKIAPGQAFLLANDVSALNNQIVFTQNMRVFNGGDDFILGRPTAPQQMLRLKAAHATADFATEIYFSETSTLGLDPGYDAALFDGVANNFMVYSHLVKDHKGKEMAIQSLGTASMNDVVVPLGLKVAQGNQITFSIENTTLPNEIQVYLEDRENNTLTLLNEATYAFTSKTAITGGGRFFLRFESRALSIEESETETLQIYATGQTLYINGPLSADSKVVMYDIQGRTVLNAYIEKTKAKNTVDVSSLSQGVYLVKLSNKYQNQVKKIIIK
ncbi:T9SS type A sorting domain-containing protein [Gelidibacter maritimus]|uniref:T9SS type A sorting domain-containing protein n=1 Tax=Gelidibacter maritimus TaxID=2761487 RepID=A0A7W2R3V5_9FLAO|nr:T9SS type A sorting domain-containing protein [Gelidibacter maritimus]MBA6153194.1 T9SS type A sorting domain-containing protein [Gelidibacter maritimus]